MSTLSSYRLYSCDAEPRHTQEYLVEPATQIMAADTDTDVEKPWVMVRSNNGLYRTWITSMWLALSSTM